MKKRFIITAALIVVITTTCIAFAHSNNNFEKDLATDNVQELINNAFAYSNAKQYKNAIKFCDKILTIDPKNEEAYLLKILALQSSHKLKDAELLQNEAIKILPDSALINLQMGLVTANKGDYRLASKYFEKSANIYPKDQTYLRLGGCYSELMEHKKAIDAYTKAIELNPKLVKAYTMRAKDCGDLGDYKCSLENYETLKKMYPNNPLYYHMTSLYKTNTKDLEGAMKDIDKAISMVKKPDATFYSQKAWIYIEKKDYDNALKYTKEALKINPNDEYTLGLLTYLAYANKDYSRVIKTAEQSFKKDSMAHYNPVLYSMYAQALYQTGDKSKALKQIEYAIKLAPENTEYKQLQEKMQKGESL